jgi:hypothetical protein
MNRLGTINIALSRLLASLVWALEAQYLSVLEANICRNNGLDLEPILYYLVLE